MQGALSGYPRVDVGLYGGSGVKVGLIVKFYCVNQSSSGHYLGEAGTIVTLSGRAGGPISLSKGGSGPVQWICCESLLTPCVVPCQIDRQADNLKIRDPIRPEAPCGNIYIDLDIARTSVML